MAFTRFLLGALSLLALVVVASISGPSGAGEKKEVPGKKVELVGVVKTGVFAIGGETTGTELHTKEGRYELAVSKELQASVEKLEGKTAKVTGTLVEKKGVEVRKRRIVTVTTIEEKK